jgi:LmbE family N-acetylglucosaminyl deacetylase
MTRIAVIVAHPDDEALAFGGSIARHAARGEAVDVLFLATGLAARGAAAAGAAALAELRAQARRAGDILGVRRVEFADFPDNRMDTAPLLDVVKRIEAFAAAEAPGAVYTHHAGDLNIDHGIVARAVLTAFRPLPDRPPLRILAGETLSSTEYAAPADRFVPNVYVDIADHLESKARALAAYAGETRAWPHPRSPEAVRHLARLRGAECGRAAAEALLLLREVAA